MEANEKKAKRRKLLFRKLLLLIGFAQLAFELNSHWLFLWPVNHFCSLPNSLAQNQNGQNGSQHTGLQLGANRSLFGATVADDEDAAAILEGKNSAGRLFNNSSSSASLELVADEAAKDSFVQAHLFVANPQNPITAAKAQAMGFEYDDISHCLAHPFELDTIWQNSSAQATINWDSLEPCQFGLSFNEFEATLSVLGPFELACSRKWLKILLPQSIGLGLLIGGLLQLSTGQLLEVSAMRVGANGEDNDEDDDQDELLGEENKVPAGTWILW